MFQFTKHILIERIKIKWAATISIKITSKSDDKEEEKRCELKATFTIYDQSTLHLFTKLHWQHFNHI